jgi:hypothetical protein
LGAAIACAVTARNIARELSEQSEIEAIKERAITADVIDEISTSAYIPSSSVNRKQNKFWRQTNRSTNRKQNSIR